MAAYRKVHLFFIVLAALAVFWRPGIVSYQDEVAQAAGLYSLGEGHLWVGDLPPPYNQGLYDHFGLPDSPGERAAPYGSTPLNFLALPVYLGLDRGFGEDAIPLGLAVVQAALLAAGVWCLSQHVPAMTARAREWSSGVGVATLLLALPDPSVARHPFVELAALELVNMTATAGIAVLVFDLVRRSFDERTALTVTGLLVFTTPLFFWGGSAKYHTLSVFFLTLALWAYRDGSRTPPRQTALAAASAGLSAWNFLPFGGILVLSLAVLALPAARLGLRQCLARWGSALGVLAGALAALALGRLLVGDVDVGEQFLPELREGRLAAYLFDPDSPTGWLAHTVLSEPWQALKASLLAWFHPLPQENGSGMGLLVSVPWAAAAIVALGRGGFRRALPRAWVWWTAVYTTLLFGIMGRFVLIGGDPVDIRYASTMWPLLALLSSPLVQAVLTSSPGRHLRASFAASSALLLALHIVVLVTFHLGLGVNAATWLGDHGVPWTAAGYVGDASLTFRFAGLLLMAATTWMAWRIRPQAAGPGVVHVMTAAVACAAMLQLVTALDTGKLEPPPGGETIPAPFVLAALRWVHVAVETLLHTVAG